MRKWKIRCLIGLMLLSFSAHAEEILCLSANDTAALITSAGEEIVSVGEWTDAFTVLEDTLWALGKDVNGATRYALCDASGNLLTDASYEMFQSAGNVVIYRKDGLYGVISQEGEILLEAKYTQLTTEDGVTYLATTSDPYDDVADKILRVSLIDDEVETGVYTDQGLKSFSDGRMLYHDPTTEFYGYLDAQGNVVISAQYQTAESFRDGLACASLQSGLGVIDTSGTWRIEAQFDFLERGDGIFVGLDGRETCVVYDSATCEELFRSDGTDLSVAVVGSYPVIMSGETMKVYNREGNVLLETSASATLRAGLDGQLILSDGEWGAFCVSLVGTDGKIAERKDQYVLPLASSRYAFYTMNTAIYHSNQLDENRYSIDYDSMRCGMMDENGTEILPAEYIEIIVLSANRFLATASDGLYIFDENGNLIWQNINSSEN